MGKFHVIVLSDSLLRESQKFLPTVAYISLART